MIGQIDAGSPLEAKRGIDPEDHVRVCGIQDGYLRSREEICRSEQHGGDDISGLSGGRTTASSDSSVPDLVARSAQDEGKNKRLTRCRACISCKSK